MSENLSRLEVLAGELDALRTEITELDAIEEPTEEQNTRFDTAMADFDTKKAAHDKLAERAAKVEQVRSATLAEVNVERSAPSVIVKRDDVFENLDRAEPAEYRERAMRAFGDGVRLRGVSDAQHEALVARIDQDDTKQMRGIAKHVLVHGSPAYRSAFRQYIESGAVGGQAVYTSGESDAIRASLALGGSTGGFVLPTLLDPTLIHTGTAVKDNLRTISRVIEGTQNVWHGVSVGNVTTAWTAEAAALSDGSPTFSNPSITAAKLTAYVTGSYEIFEDSDLQMQLPGLIGEAFSYAEQTAFIVGSGSNAPKGIITAISATAASTVTATTRGQFNSASAADVFAVVNAVTPRYEESSTWVGNKATFNSVRQMSTASQGSYFWTNFNNEVVPGSQPLLGSPVLQASDMASAQTSGTVLLVLGDFSQFVIYDRIGTSVEFVQNVFNSSALPLGQRGLIAHKRVGSDVTDVNAFRFLKT